MKRDSLSLSCEATETVEIKETGHSSNYLLSSYNLSPIKNYAGTDERSYLEEGFVNPSERFKRSLNFQSSRGGKASKYFKTLDLDLK